MYFATKNRMIRIAYNNAEIQSFLDDGWSIICRDNNGNETIVGENGNWIKEKPDVEKDQNEVEKFNKKILQMAADLDYLSMMTGIEF